MALEHYSLRFSVDSYGSRQSKSYAPKKAITAICISTKMFPLHLVCYFSLLEDMAQRKIFCGQKQRYPRTPFIATEERVAIPFMLPFKAGAQYVQWLYDSIVAFIVPKVNSRKFGGAPVIVVAFQEAWDYMETACVAIEQRVPESYDKDEYDKVMDDANFDLDLGIRNLLKAMDIEVNDSGAECNIMNTIEAHERLDKWIQRKLDGDAAISSKDKDIIKALWATTHLYIRDLRASLARLPQIAPADIPVGSKVTPRSVRITLMDWDDGSGRPPTPDPWTGRSVLVSTLEPSAGTLVQTWIHDGCDWPVRSGHSTSFDHEQP